MIAGFIAKHQDPDTLFLNSVRNQLNPLSPFLAAKAKLSPSICSLDAGCQMPVRGVHNISNNFGDAMFRSLQFFERHVKGLPAK